ncbi:MAG: YuzF family protein [Lysinibacillus sp.]|nr:YuzF family protein [Lysinibacillus sp.]
MNGMWNMSDPYVYETLMRFQNQSIAVQTARGSVRGMLRMVMPDHIVVEMGGSPFYVRTEQIIWFHPLRNVHPMKHA